MAGARVSRRIPQEAWLEGAGGARRQRAGKGFWILWSLGSSPPGPGMTVYWGIQIESQYKSCPVASTSVELKGNGSRQLGTKVSVPFLVEFAGLTLSLGSSPGLCKWTSVTVTLLREGGIQGFEMLLWDPVLQSGWFAEQEAVWELPGAHCFPRFLDQITFSSLTQWWAKNSSSLCSSSIYALGVNSHGN